MDTSDPYNLQRFIDAQHGVIDIAFSELRAGSKQSHWMWFVFPQLADLGRSPTAKYFGIMSVGEANDYLDDDVLGARLRQCVEALLPWTGKRTAEQILGPVDMIKLKSCLTLFDRIEAEGPFEQGLVNFFGGKRDELTLALLERQQ